MIKNIDLFQSFHYQRHNRRRQEHLASLCLPITGKTVLEVGAGIGDHTSFFVDRQCSVTSTDGRPELLEILQFNNPKAKICLWDVEKSPPVGLMPAQIVYAYGLLYHTQVPDLVLSHLSDLCTEMLLLETCVSYGSEKLIHVTQEALNDPTQALAGSGCRPTRIWVFEQLKKFFPYVYVTKSQPWHEEFPIDWATPKVEGSGDLLNRSVFIAARFPIDNDYLSTDLSDLQVRI